MTSFIRTIGVFTLIFILNSGYSQWRDYHFTTKSAEDGLTSNIFEIAQDSVGFMYFGTSQGLIRYDGKVFSPFYHDPADEKTIGPGDVWALHSGSDGKIWIGLRFGGLNVFDPKKAAFKRYPLPKLNPDDLPSVNSIIGDKNKLWVGASHFRLHLFDIEKEEYETFTPSWPNINLRQKRLSIVSIIQDKRNPDVLWLTVLGYHPPDAHSKNNLGVVQFKKSSKEFISQPCDCQLSFQDEKGILWGKSHGGGIWQYNPQTKDCFSKTLTIQLDKPLNPVIHDLKEEKEFIWVASSNAISKISKNGEEIDIVVSDKKLKRVSKIFKDREENIWFGRSNGLQVIDKQKQHIKFYSLGELGIQDRIYPGMLAFDKKNETVYFSNYRDKIYQIPLDTEKAPKQFKHSSIISSIAHASDDSLYFVADGKLNVLVNEFDAIAPNVYHQADFAGIWKMIFTNSGILCGLGSNKFNWLNPGEDHVKSIDIASLPGYNPGTPGFEDFSILNSGEAIFHSENIYIVDLETEASKQYFLDPALNPDQLEIRSIVQDNEDNFWISLPNRIASFELMNDSLLLKQSFSSKDGFESQWYDELFKDYQGRIWAFSSNGINCIDPTSNEIRYFGVKDGLPSHINDPVQLIEISDHQIASVCSNGIIIFHPDSLWNNAVNYQVPILIKKIAIDGKELKSEFDPNFLNEIYLDPDEKMLNIEFQGLALPVDDYLVYSYQLEGQNENWVYLGKTNQIAFQNLSAGNYTFNIKAGNPDSNGIIKSITIIVEAPFYDRLWFQFLLGLIFISGLYLFYRYRINSIKKTEEEKSAQVLQMAELELKALRSQMNPHFMFNSLNSIKNFILQAKPYVAAEYLSNFAHLLRMILQNSREKTISLKAELETLLLYIDLEKIRFEDKFDFAFEQDNKLELERIMIPPMILQPFIENAIWHGLMNKKTRGHLQLQIITTENGVKCIIEDDGVGREKALKIKNSFTKKYKSLGMGITQERIDILNKLNSMGIELEIIDKKDEAGKACGTKIIVTVPGNSFES